MKFLAEFTTKTWLGFHLFDVEVDSEELIDKIDQLKFIVCV